MTSGMTVKAGDQVADREHDTIEQRRGRPVANRRGGIPERLNYLFQTVHAPDRRPYSAAEVARWINDNGGKISSVYILKILNGERTDPSQRYLKEIARYFGVSPAFFWEDDPAELDGEALNTQILLRDDLVQSMMLRAARLSRGQQEALSGIIDSLLRAEGKDPAED
jgi:transcriptional regulator with XRE-family HTH domain